MFGKIQFFENRRREFHFCRLEIDYTTFASVVWVRKTGLLVSSKVQALPAGIWLFDVDNGGTGTGCEKFFGLGLEAPDGC